MNKGDKKYHVKEFYDGEKKLEKVVLEIKKGIINKIHNKGYESKEAVEKVAPTFVDLQIYGSSI